MTFVQIEERGRTPVLTLDLRLDASVQGAQEHLRWRWISRGIVLDLSDWLSLDAFLGWRLRSSTMVVQTWDKKGREKREKEYVSPAAAAYIQQGAEKRGHLSST